MWGKGTIPFPATFQVLTEKQPFALYEEGKGDMS
jgi:hypothetical protein